VIPGKRGKLSAASVCETCWIKILLSTRESHTHIIKAQSNRKIPSFCQCHPIRSAKIRISHTHRARSSTAAPPNQPKLPIALHSCSRNERLIKALRLIYSIDYLPSTRLSAHPFFVCEMPTALDRWLSALAVLSQSAQKLPGRWHYPNTLAAAIPQNI
jgi:hypothetical protein